MDGRAGAHGLPDIETPAALVDLQKVLRNAHRAAEYCSRHGLAWRPHVKTHKCTRVARIELDAGARGLTVATSREAEVMASVCDDIVVAYPPVGRGRVRRLVNLPERVRVTVALDSLQALEALSREAASQGRTVGVLVEIDAGARRVGVPAPGDALALAGRATELPGVEYRGIAFYPGHIRIPLGQQGPDLARVGDILGTMIAELEKAGLPPAVVSGGSSPTLWRSHELPGLTEVRAGTCIFNDRDMVGLEVCDLDECAYTVVATVVSTAARGRAVVDAGSKALSKEAIRSGGSGFGILLERPEVSITGLNEEHGIIVLEDTPWRPRVGDLVRVIPNHVCLSVNLQDALLVVTEAGLDCWPLEARGRGPLPTFSAAQ